MGMTDAHKNTTAAARESVEPSNTDAKQSDGMGSESEPGLPTEEAEEEAAAKLGDFA